MGFFSSITKPFKKAWDAVEGAVSNTWDAVVDTTKDVVDLAAPLVGAGSQLAGGIMSSNATSASNAANLALAREQFDWQKEYAKNRLQWQVEDAKKAGLHPMVAAGLSPASFSSVSANLSPVDYDWVGQVGQSLAYAATKAKTNKQQQMAFDYQMQLGEEQLNGVRLDNELKVMQILGMVSQLNQTGPAAPDLNGGKNLIGGQNDSPSSSSLTSGVSPLMGASRVGNSLFLHLNPDIADSITEDFVRNMVANIAAEGSIPRMYADIARRFSKEEQEALKRGDAELRYVGPSQIQFLWRPHMRPKYSADKKSVSGRLKF